MGHHIKDNGAFQSDKHPWLPEDTILINPARPQSRDAFTSFLATTCTEFKIRQPTEEYPYPKTKFIVFFDDERNILLLQEVARAYEDAGNGLSEDIRARLRVLHPHKF